MVGGFGGVGRVGGKLGLETELNVGRRPGAFSKQRFSSRIQRRSVERARWVRRVFQAAKASSKGGR
jgi:hypothetical protein